jgi:hypothetical protein
LRLAIKEKDRYLIVVVIRIRLGCCATTKDGFSPFGEKRALFSKKKSQIRKKNHLAFYILSKIEIVVKKGVVIFWPLAVLFFLEAVYTLLHLSGLDNKHPEYLSP